MALDGLGQNMYWIDEGSKTVSVASLKDGQKRKTLITQGIHRLTSIAVDSLNGYLFWSQVIGVGLENGVIEQAWMDGSNRKILIKTKIIFPHSLTVHSDKRLYWCDEKLQRIEGISVHGSNQDRIHLHINKYQPRAMAMDQYSIYWFDSISNSIFRNFWNNSEEPPKLLMSDVEDVFAMSVFTIREQDWFDHSCSNSPCPDMCLVTPLGHSCKCRDGMYDIGNQCKKFKGWLPPSLCETTQFQCGNSSHCIENDYLCDGENDCFDSSDETKMLCSNRTCNGKAFKCDGICLLQSQVCDGKKDCDAGSDETDCKENCEEGSFHCLVSGMLGYTLLMLSFLIILKV